MIKSIVYGCDCCDETIDINKKSQYHFKEWECPEESQTVNLLCKKCALEWYQKNKEEDVYIFQDGGIKRYAIYFNNEKCEFEYEGKLIEVVKIKSLLKKSTFNLLMALCYDDIECTKYDRPWRGSTSDILLKYRME